MEFKVRELTVKDLPEIMAEEREAWDAPGGPVLSLSEDAIREWLERYPPGNIGLFDAEKNVLAGKCMWQPVREVSDTWESNVAKGNLDPKSKECYVMNFDVRPGYRGTGASDALMKAALESMATAGMERVWLGGRDIESNRRFYGGWLELVEIIKDYWIKDVEAGGRGVLYTADLRQPVEKRRVV